MRHFTCVDAFPNIICSFLHFGHLIFMNFDFVSSSMFFIFSSRCFYFISSFFVLMPDFCTVIFLHTVHSYLRSNFLLCFLFAILHFVIGGFEYLPLLPSPILPLCWILFLLPLLRGFAVPLVFLFASTIFCSVCFLQ